MRRPAQGPSAPPAKRGGSDGAGQAGQGQAAKGARPADRSRTDHASRRPLGGVGGSRQRPNGLIAAVALALLAIGGALFWLWQRSAADSADGPLPRSFQAQPVPTPGGGLNTAVTAQLDEAFRAVERATGPGAGRTGLGSAYGRLAQILLAYELPGIEPALANARALLPKDYRWPYYQALWSYRQGRLDEAIAGYAAALDLAPEDIPTRLHLAEAYLEADRGAEAEPLLAEAERQDPRYFWVHALWGRLEAARGQPREAVLRYERALQLDPKALMLYRPLAAAYRDLGETARADALEARSSSAPFQGRDPLLGELEALRVGKDVWLRQARELQIAGRLAEAQALVDRVLAEDPAQPEALSRQAALLAAQGDHAAAEAAARQALANDPPGTIGAEAWYQLGMAQYNLSRQAEAEASFAAGLERDPNLIDAHGALATALRRGGRCAEALPHYRAILDQDPRRVVVHLDLAVCLATAGRNAEALAALQEARQRFPEDLDLKLTLARLLAWAPEPDLRDAAQALTLAQAVVAGRRRPDSLEALAMAQAAAGDRAAAVATQAQAVSLAAADPAWEAWRPHLADTAAALGRGEAAPRPWPELALAH